MAYTLSALPQLIPNQCKQYIQNEFWTSPVLYPEILAAAMQHSDGSGIAEICNEGIYWILIAKNLSY